MSSKTLDRLEFAIVLAEECRAAWTADIKPAPFRVAALADKLIKAGRRLHRMAEANCDGFDNHDDRKAHDDKVERARNRVHNLVNPYGITARFSGDPRGCCLKLFLPITKRTNGRGGEGYCVPS